MLLQFKNCSRWKDVAAGHESIGPKLILIEREVKNYVKLRRLIIMGQSQTGTMGGQ